MTETLSTTMAEDGQHRQDYELPPPEFSPDVEFEELDHETRIADPKFPIMDKESTRSVWGYNGSLVSAIELPTDDVDQEPKVLGIIDFGSLGPEEKKAIVFLGRELTELAVTPYRFLLVSLNFHPEDRLLGVVPLNSGKQVILGRTENNRDAFLLGLLDNPSPQLSREHLTIELDEKGRFEITDHSTNHTRVAARTS